MGARAARGLKVGTIIDKTLGVVEGSAVAVLLYLVALTAINGAITWYSLSLTLSGGLALSLLSFLVDIVGGYLLLVALLRNTGFLAPGQRETFYPFLALTLVYSIVSLVGFALIILPGLLVLARWSIAQPMMVARGGSVMKTLGESWEQTKGNELPILGAAFAMILPFIAVVIASLFLFEQGDLVGLGIAEVASNVMSLAIYAMGVALYGLIAVRGSAAEVFG